MLISLTISTKISLLQYFEVLKRLTLNRSSFSASAKLSMFYTRKLRQFDTKTKSFPENTNFGKLVPQQNRLNYSPTNYLIATNKRKHVCPTFV